jgi:3-deoxy-D-manno-octulosonic-acid transferase
MPVEWAGYLPWDLADEMAPVLDAVRPRVVAFTKTEIWPGLVAEADVRRIPVALVGGTVPPGARRARWPARAVLRSTWARLSLVAAIAEEDAVGFRALGVPHERIRVTGDPGIDSAAARARSADPDAPFLRAFHEVPRPTVVAGSTWESDLEVLLPALLDTKGRIPGLRIVLAPHEPDAPHVRDVVETLRVSGWRSATLTQVEREGATDVDAVVVDRVGALAHLYTVGQVAYVGGGFHDAGLHSVLEPAAARLPVAFGPRHRNARAAADLLAGGGARQVDDAEGLAEALVAWLGDDRARDYVGRRAFGYIDAHLGAAGRTAALLDDLLTPA